MIKVKKISLENFKGIRSKTAFHFDNDGTHVNVLSGPNGFGKTTIFDVIEICLTGDFKRVEYFNHVQKKTTSRNKPFFQNTDGEDVILKLWISDTTTDSSYIIIKHYVDLGPARISRGRDFIPEDSKNLFKTYLTTDPVFFDSNDFESLSQANQDEINAIFFGADAIVDLKSTYYLFNYIQQEDSIYFLRKNEDDKGASLGFLFNIEREESEKKKIQELRDYLSQQLDSVNDQRNQLRASLPNAQIGEYEKLFQDKNFDFDKEHPFSQIMPNRNQLEPYKAIVDSLIELRNKFSPDEYDKSLKFKKLNDEILGNQNILRAIPLRAIYDDNLLTTFELINSKMDAATKFLQTEDNKFIQKEYFDLFLPASDEHSTYAVIENSIRDLDRDLGDIGKIISELNSVRRTVLEKFVLLKSTNHTSDNNCPLCDTSFESFDNLERAINAKTFALEEFNSEKLRQKSLLEDQIKLFHSRISESVSNFISGSSITEQIVLALFREYSSLKQKIDSIFETYPELNGPGMAAINFLTPPKTEAEVKEKTSLLRQFLSSDLLSQFTYNEQLLENKDLYIQYFDADRTKFLAISVDMLRAKSYYLQGSYMQLANLRLVFLDARSEKISRLLERVTDTFDIVHRTIQEHKAEMIEKIKIPFYIYSGKILQSYQQGLGIFVKIHSTGQSNNVLFKTGHSSDHDIVYHLSSGQMAVVSLAFCLSLNKVYNTNDHFKFLSIDDPIQTMDDLNIHTFIELVRNEFKEYQIIMSTHDDFTSRYMKYKFDKFDMSTEIQNVQKIVLEQSLD